MKYLMIGLVCIGLIGCENEFSYNHKIEQKLPNELADCKVFDYGNATIFRCPNSQTSTTQKVGKHIVTTVVIDGVEYTKKGN